MKCPNCDVDLRRTDIGEAGFVVLDACDRCNGAWFDEGELDALDDSPGSNAESMDYDVIQTDDELPQCPVCGGSMTLLSPKEAPELVIDRCDACHGFWLDQGELDDVRAALLRADSLSNNQVEQFLRPPGWSMLKWMIYRLDKAYGAKR